MPQGKCFIVTFTHFFLNRYDSSLDCTRRTYLLSEAQLFGAESPKDGVGVDRKKGVGTFLAANGSVNHNSSQESAPLKHEIIFFLTVSKRAHQRKTSLTEISVLSPILPDVNFDVNSLGEAPLIC